MKIPPKVTDMRGRVIGRLTVREFAGIRNNEAYWICDCACGIEGKEIRGKNLRRAQEALAQNTRPLGGGLTLSCGCYRADKVTRRAARLKTSARRRRAIARMGANARHTPAQK